MASSIVTALLKTNVRFGAFAQTEAGQDFVLELEQAIETAEAAARQLAPLTDMRAVELQAVAAVQQAAETRLANLLTATQLVITSLD